MRRLAILPLLVLGLSGCGMFRGAEQRAAQQPASFSPAAMRFHPIFTRIKDFDGDNYPDGIDALLEFQDQFGDPTKAAGRAIFELYAFQKFDPQRKGDRLANPWIGSLETVEDQKQRWNRTSRTYSFLLAYDRISLSGTYVLTAEFQLANGARYYDQLVLEPPAGAYAPRGAAAPTTSSSGLPFVPNSESSSQP